MNNLPLHPAVVHLPIALAVLVPLLAAGTGLAVWRGALPRRAWTIVVVAQALLVATGLLAMRTGESEEERVEHRVSERAIEAHEEAAEVFLWGAGVTLAVTAAALVVPAPAVLAAAILATVVTAGLGFRVGHAGAELVYGPGGLTAEVPARPASAGPASSAGPHEHDHD